MTFFKRCGPSGGQYSCADVLDRNRYLSWFCPVPQHVDHDKECVNVIKIKLCRGVHIPFASKLKFFALQHFVL